ncbi:MAG: hypothetical protein Q7K35_03920 [bacterium]|nr:hypothetical protein [bacterium]
MSEKPRSLDLYVSNYGEELTDDLKLHNQSLKLDASKDKTEKPYEEPKKGMKIIELLEDVGDHELKVIGHCTYKIYEDPVPFLYASWVVRKKKLEPRSEAELKDKTTGDLVMEQINDYIKGKNLPGILNNAVPANAQARNLYERNGWVFIEGNWMGYNLPADLNESQIAEIIKNIKADDPYFSTHPEEADHQNHYDKAA